MVYGMQKSSEKRNNRCNITRHCQLSHTTSAVYSSSGAFDQGYQNGRDARLNDGSSQAYCDPNNNAQNPDAYCALYKSGYFAGWNAAGLLYGDQQNNNNDDN
jgi:hypothetical protein